MKVEVNQEERVQAMCLLIKRCEDDGEKGSHFLTPCCNGGSVGKAVHDICKMCCYKMPLAIVYSQIGAQQLINQVSYCSQW